MQSRLMTSLMAIGVALFFFACSDGGEEGEDPKLTNEPCVANKDCADNVCHMKICASPTPLVDGKVCEGNGDCKSFNCASLKCAPGAAKAGGECMNNEECASLNCESGKCALRKEGDACAADAECSSGVCYSKKCVKSCTKQADCGAKQDCISDDGKRLFCNDVKYLDGIGTLCGVDGRCPTNFKCAGTANDAAAYCTNECKTNLDCPPAFFCNVTTDTKFYCQPNKFCSYCLHDDQCPTGQKCVSYGGEKICSRTCNSGSTECPMFAECKDIGGGSGHYCVHKSGTCKKKGKLCDPCTMEADCDKGSACLTFNMSQESFCGTDCTGGGACPTNYKCYKVSATANKCGPAGATTSAMPTCVSKLTNIMNVGDVADDFAVVGLKDSNGDNDLTDETLSIVKLSDYKDKKIILLNVSAFW